MKSKRFWISFVVALLSASPAWAVTITYDGDNRPILFEGVSYPLGSGLSPLYDVSISWDQSFESTFGDGYKNSGGPYDPPAFIGEASTYWQLHALSEALVDDGYATSIGRGSADVVSYMIVPYTVFGPVTTAGQWIVEGHEVNLLRDNENLLAGINPGQFYDDFTVGAGYTRWALAAATVPEPGTVVAFASGLLGLFGVSVRSRRSG